jgi:hypothetical protein
MVEIVSTLYHYVLPGRKIVIYMQRYFVPECAGTPFWKFFLRRMQIKMAFWNIFFLASIYLTPLQPNLVSLCVVEL